MSTYGEDDKQKGNLGGNPNSHIPAHESLAVAAPFRAWPGSPTIIARGPKGSPLNGLKSVHFKAGKIITNSDIQFKLKLHNSSIFCLTG